VTARPGAAAGIAVAVWLAAGCAGGSDSASKPDPSASTSSPSETVSPAPTPDGVDASGDLSEFACEVDDTGRWDASGVLVSSARTVGDYEVTVVVTGPGESSASGRQRVLLGVAPGEPTAFEIPDVPAVGSGDLTCQVQVVRLTG